ncbi:pyridoxal phosphate-dependent aminotransferase [Enterococcus sp. 669A]|uniref:cysteine-S-conjugate beta-lyase n=1 Tax=Candidatus Enterococcus moelleringii TaxID=2815325 RepID=A0ABS3LA16_9ENTE|nr:MalY/PatB family protein [Enterococcus sp. 669A]MBO1306470.1 pyridoxal phosphate-dependent aminotransferase [Enterococcus sp. 669A]
MSYDFDRMIERKNTYSTQWDYIEDRFGRSDLLPFSISDTDFQAPNEILEELRRVVDHGVFGYSRWNHEDYKQTISRYYKNAHQTEVQSDWVVYSPSVLYSISVLLRQLTKEQENVLVFDPMYDAFINVVEKNNRKLVTVPLNRETNYEIDFALFEEKAAQCQVFLLCSPHNPTGKVFSKGEMDELIRICQKYQVTIISDEIHSDVILFRNTHYPLLNWYNKYEHLIIVSSASKTFNIPGLGGSYALIPSKELREAFLVQTKERDFVNSPSIMGMTATMTAYNHCQDYTAALVSYIEGNMTYLANYLECELPEIAFQLPQATYLAWLDVRGLGYSSEKLQEGLVNVGKVGIMRGEVYGENGRGFLRMNLGCPRAKMIEGLERMKQSLDYLKDESYVK